MLESTSDGSDTDREPYSEEYISDIFVRIVLHESPDDEESYSYHGGNHLASSWEKPMWYGTRNEADTYIFDDHRDMWPRKNHKKSGKK